MYRYFYICCKNADASADHKAAEVYKAPVKDESGAYTDPEKV